MRTICPAYGNSNSNITKMDTMFIVAFYYNSYISSVLYRHNAYIYMYVDPYNQRSHSKTEKS